METFTRLFQEQHATSVGITIVDNVLDMIQKVFRKTSETELEGFFNYQLTLLDKNEGGSDSTEHDAAETSKPLKFTNDDVTTEMNNNLETDENTARDEIMTLMKNEITTGNTEI